MAGEVSFDKDALSFSWMSTATIESMEENISIPGKELRIMWWIDVWVDGARYNGGGLFYESSNPVVTRTRVGSKIDSLIIVTLRKRWYGKQ